MTNSEARIVRLEMLLSSISRTLDKMSQRLDNLESQVRQIPNGGGGGGGGSSVASYWVRGTFAAATGTWPALVPDVQSLDVYKDDAGTLTLFAASSDVRWFYKDVSGANKLIPVEPNGDGSYDAVAASCTAV